MSGPRFYEEPPQCIIHLYEQHDDESWYPKPDQVIMDEYERTESHNWEHDQRVNCLHIAANREKKTENPKHIQAQKEGKVDYSCVPWRIMYMLAQAMEEGARKYGRFNYREDSIEARTYIAAICRHLFGDPATGSVGWVNGEDIDPDSDLPHLIKIMADCLLVLDAKHHDKLIDNRLDTESKDVRLNDEDEK